MPTRSTPAPKPALKPPPKTIPSPRQEAKSRSARASTKAPPTDLTLEAVRSAGQHQLLQNLIYLIEETKSTILALGETQNALLSHSISLLIATSLTEIIDWTIQGRAAPCSVTLQLDPRFCGAERWQATVMTLIELPTKLLKMLGKRFAIDPQQNPLIVLRAILKKCDEDLFVPGVNVQAITMRYLRVYNAVAEMMQRCVGGSQWALLEAGHSLRELEAARTDLANVVLNPNGSVRPLRRLLAVESPAVGLSESKGVIIRLFLFISIRIMSANYWPKGGIFNPPVGKLLTRTNAFLASLTEGTLESKRSTRPYEQHLAATSSEVVARSTDLLRELSQYAHRTRSNKTRCSWGVGLSCLFTCMALLFQTFYQGNAENWGFEYRSAFLALMLLGGYSFWHAHHDWEQHKKQQQVLNQLDRFIHHLTDKMSGVTKATSLLDGIPQCKVTFTNALEKIPPSGLARLTYESLLLMVLTNKDTPAIVLLPLEDPNDTTSLVLQCMERGGASKVLHPITSEQLILQHHQQALAVAKCFYQIQALLNECMGKLQGILNALSASARMSITTQEVFADTTFEKRAWVLLTLPKQMHVELTRLFESQPYFSPAPPPLGAGSTVKDKSTVEGKVCFAAHLCSDLPALQDILEQWLRIYFPPSTAEDAAGAMLTETAMLPLPRGDGGKLLPKTRPKAATKARDPSLPHEAERSTKDYRICWRLPATIQRDEMVYVFDSRMPQEQFGNEAIYPLFGGDTLTDKSSGCRIPLLFIILLPSLLRALRESDPDCAERFLELCRTGCLLGRGSSGFEAISTSSSSIRTNQEGNLYRARIRATVKGPDQSTFFWGGLFGENIVSSKKQTLQETIDVEVQVQVGRQTENSDLHPVLYVMQEMENKKRGSARR